MSQNQAHNPAPLFKNKMGFLLSKEKIWTFCNICKKENKNSSGVKLCTNIQQQKQDSLQGDCWICSWLMEEPCPPGGHWDLDSPSQVVQGPRRTLFLSLAPGAFVYLLFTLDASARASTGVDCTNANQARRGEGGGVRRRGDACFCSPSRRDSVWSEPEPSQGASNNILRVFWIKANQLNHVYPRPPLKIQQTPALHLAFWLTAPYFPSLLPERAEKKEKKRKAQHRGKLRGKKRRHGGKHRRWKQEKRKWYNRRLAGEAVFFRREGQVGKKEEGIFCKWRTRLAVS